MFRKLLNSRWMIVVTLAIVLGLLLPMAVAPVAQAKSGDIIKIGIVQAKPATGIGTWKIGGKSYVSTRSTQLSPLPTGPSVGQCAKVKIRNGAVHEISKEPLSDC